MIKSELVKTYAARTNSSYRSARKDIDVVLDILVEELKNGESIVFNGFGKLFTHQKSAERIRRDPRNGKPVRAKYCTTIRFKPCRKFLDQLNLAKSKKEENRNSKNQ